MIWIATYNGLNRFDGYRFVAFKAADSDGLSLWKEKEVYTDLGNLHLKNIRRDDIDRQGNHWLIDDHGIFVATPVHARGTRINDEEVRAMARLHNGTIITSGRSSKQVIVYDSAFHLIGYVHPDGHLSKTPTSFGDQPYCFYESRDGKHSWIGCKPGCLLRGDNDTHCPKCYLLGRQTKLRCRQTEPYHLSTQRAQYGCTICRT